MHQLHLPACLWLVRRGLGCKSKAGKKRSSAPFAHACAETHTRGGLGQQLRHGEVELGMGACVCVCVCVHAQGAQAGSKATARRR